MVCNHNLKDKGFSLLELMLALGLLGVITVFVVSLSKSVNNLAKTSETRSRMKEIGQALADYYSGHRDLPAPVNIDEVPVQAAALNLEQKYRMDGWGRYLYYDRAVSGARTDIIGTIVDGKNVAAVLISGGPDQTIEAANASSPYSTAGDDIVIAITVTSQAQQVVLNDLEVLQTKVQAFDAIFAGVDNDTDGSKGEDGCNPLSGCPFSAVNDPSCGVATLDNISGYGACGYPVTSEAAFISSFYDLGSAIQLDPWLNVYAWGKPPGCTDADLCYHKFYSYGPDGTPGTGDDIVP